MYYVKMLARTSMSVNKRLTRGRRPSLILEKLENRLLLTGWPEWAPEATKPAELRVVLINDSLAQAESVRAASKGDTIPVVYSGSSMTTERMVDTLADLSRNHGGALISHLAIVAHGSSGTLDIGAEKWNRQQLETDRQWFSALSQWLNEDARIDLYGCYVASGEVGQSFVDELAALTRAEVYASDNAVGNETLGDLTWEYASGHSNRSDELLSSQQLQKIDGFVLPLPAPALTSPANGATNQSILPTLTWQSVAGATTYRVFVATSTSQLPTGLNNPGSVYVFNNTTSSTSLTLPALSTNSKYYWQVRAGNSTDTGFWSSYRSFTTALPISAPTLLSPANGATNQALQTTLSWQASSGASSYNVVVYTSLASVPTGSNNPTSGHVFQQTTSNTSAQATFSPGTTYYWAVRAGNSSTSVGSVWSAARSFTTAPPLTVPIQVSPSNSATNQALQTTLSWQAVSGANSYNVVVYTSLASVPTGSNNPTSGHAFQQTTANTSAQGTFSPGTTYYWAVRAGNTNTGVGSVWSAARSFTTAPPLTVPIQVSPSNSATNQALQTALSWQAVSGANSYNVVVYTSLASVPTGSSDPTSGYAFQQTTANTSAQATFSPGTTYYWAVRAGNTNTGVGSVWSAARSFTTAAPLTAPIQVSPSNSASDQALQTTLSWQAVSGANSYNVVVYTSLASVPTGSTDPTSGHAFQQTTANTSAQGTFSPGTTYYWAVRAGNTNTGVGSVWSAARSFTTAAPLTAPIQVSPSNSATDQALQTTLSWQAVSGANSYNVVVYTSLASVPTGSTDPTSGHVFQETTANTSAQATFSPGTTYYWAVRAGNTNTGVGSVWSAARSFTTAPPLTAPIQVSPSNSATNQALQTTLSWQAVGGANSYNVVVYTSLASVPTGSNDPTSGHVFQETTANTSAQATFSPGTTYYWAVRAGNTNTGVGSVWSAARSFTTAPPLTAPIQVSPSNSATNQALQTTLSWQAVGGANSYNVVVYTSLASVPTGSNDPTSGHVFQETTANTSAQATFSPGTTYYWAVRAGNTNTGVGSVWSAARSFTTVATGTAGFPTTVLLDKTSMSEYGTSLNAFAFENSQQHLEGECTWYVYGRVVELASTGYLQPIAKTLMENAFWGKSGRDAKVWEEFLGGTWTSTATTPLPMAMRVPGQIVVWTGAPHGHVAFLEEISADKTQYRLSEYNVNDALPRTYSDDKWFNFEGTSDFRLGGYPKFYQLPLMSTTALAAPPVLVTPGNLESPGVNLTTAQPTFQWQTVSGATQYDLRIRRLNTDGTPGSLVFESSTQGISLSGTTTTYTLPAGILEDGGYYRWSMRSQDSEGWGTVYAPALYFSVNALAAPAYNQPFLTDAQLVAADTMNAEQIRDFLAAQGSYFSQSRPDVDGVVFDAAQVIYEASQVHTINPEVLLTTLQKESGMVTSSTRPSDLVLRNLMGAGTVKQTAREQLAMAAQLLRSYQEGLVNNGQTVSGWKLGVARATEDGVLVTPATRAVAGQFTYTPHAGQLWGGSSPGGVSLFAKLWQQFNFGGTWSDTVPPVVTAATGNASSATRNANMQFSWTATDNVAVHHTALYLYQNGSKIDTSVYGIPNGNVDGRLGLGAEYLLNTGSGTYDWTVFSSLPLGNYSIKVVAWDGAGLPSSGTLPNGVLRYKWIDFAVTNAAPTDISLSNQSIAENLAGGIIGALAVADTDPSDSHVLTVSDSRFEVVSGSLKLRDGEKLDFETTATVDLNITATDSSNAQKTKLFTINVMDLPEMVGGVTIGDGTVQRSMVQKLTLTFEGTVTIADGAFSVVKRGTEGGTVATSFTATAGSNGQTVVVLNFSGEFTRGAGTLTDGYYQLSMDGTKISRNGQLLDNNSDGQGGDSLTLGANEADNFFALYGDINGDGLVGISEFGAFRNAFGKSSGQEGFNELFDYTNDGAIGISDFGQFRSRFGKPKLLLP